MVSNSLPRATSVIEAGIAAGLHPGAQLYVSLDGEVVADIACGQSRPGVAMLTDTVMLWMSTGKPITAVAIAQQWEADRLRLDDRVADHIPEFARHGKGTISIRHLLTHTGGIRTLRTGWPEASWDEIVATLTAMRPEPRWVPGEKAGYHLQSSWFILAEIVRRLDGRPFDRYVREEIFERAGLTNCWIGMPSDVYDGLGDRLGRFVDTKKRPAEPRPWHERRHVVGCAPGGNGHGPIRELGRLYETLLRGGTTANGARLLRPQTVEALTARHRVGLFDHTFRAAMDWGLGFIPNSRPASDETDLPYHYGRHASNRAFGHSGYRSSTAYTDPHHGLVVAAVFNGTPTEMDHRHRMTALNEAVYEDLGLAEDLESAP